jgi:hypothetical protein
VGGYHHSQARLAPCLPGIDVPVDPDMHFLGKRLKFFLQVTNDRLFLPGKSIQQRKLLQKFRKPFFQIIPPIGWKISKILDSYHGERAWSMLSRPETKSWELKRKGISVPLSQLASLTGWKRTSIQRHSRASGSPECLEKTGFPLSRE